MTPPISPDPMLVFLSMLTATYSTRLVGFFTLRNHTLSKRATAVTEAAPDHMLISVIAPYLVSDKPHKLITITLTVLAADHLSTLPTILVNMATSGLFDYLLQ